jgi:hypothetical protein
MNMQYAQAVMAHEKALFDRATGQHANARRLPWSVSRRVPALVGSPLGLEPGNDGE